MIQNEKLKYDIHLSDSEIAELSKQKFKHIVNTQVGKFAFSHLIECGKSHSKSVNVLQNLKNSKLVPQNYIFCNKLSKTDIQLLFNLRCRNLDVKCNYKIKYKNNLTCRTCDDPNSLEN